MLDEVGRRASARALLTDTLPYEVPVIFSNDKLFSGLVSPNSTASLPAQRLIDRIRKLGAEVTKPYAYSIIKLYGSIDEAQHSASVDHGKVSVLHGTRYKSIHFDATSLNLPECYQELRLDGPPSVPPKFPTSDELMARSRVLASGQTVPEREYMSSLCETMSKLYT